MSSPTQVKWHEVRKDFGMPEMCIVIGTRTTDGWIFDVRSSWDMRFSPLESDESLEERANLELRSLTS